MEPQQPQASVGAPGGVSATTTFLEGSVVQMTGEGSMSRCSPKGDLSVILPSLDGAESVLVVKLSGGYDYWVSPAGCMG